MAIDPGLMAGSTPEPDVSDLSGIQGAANVAPALGEVDANSKHWIDLPLDRKHIDENVVEAAVKQFEADLDILIKFIDVGDRPAFHLVPTDDEQLDQWNDPVIKPEMVADAMLVGGPKAVAELIDHMADLEKSFWARKITESRRVEARGGS